LYQNAFGIRALPGPTVTGGTYSAPPDLAGFGWSKGRGRLGEKNGRWGGKGIRWKEA